VIPLDLTFKGAHRRGDGSQLTLESITPEAEHLQLALLVMTPPVAGLTRWLTEKGRQHE